MLQQLLFFWIVPQVAESYWPSFLNLREHLNVGIYTYMVIIVNALQFATLISGNLYFYFFYKAKISFFEKYKSVEEPWPWESNKEEWR